MSELEVLASLQVESSRPVDLALLFCYQKFFTNETVRVDVDSIEHLASWLPLQTLHWLATLRIFWFDQFLRRFRLLSFM